MQSDEDNGLGDLEVQLASKEREWKVLQAAKVHQLESSFKKAQEECFFLRERYQQLKEDFQFNLAVLDERDRELERYDVLTARARTVEHNRQEELNQLRMQVAKLEKQTEDGREELRKSRLQLDEVKRSATGEIQKQTEEYERMKWDLQGRIQEVEEELVLQRQEMTAASHNELRQQEHEFNLKMDEMRAVVLSRDLKVKLLCNETEVHCQTQHQFSEALKASQEFCLQIQSQLQHKDQEIRDLTADKDYKIKELEDKLKWTETKLKKEEDDHIKRYEEMVQSLKQCDAQLEAQCRTYTERLQKAEKHMVKLQEDVECLAAQLCRVQEHQREAMEQKDETIQRLGKEVEATRTGWDKYVSQVLGEMVAKDTEVITLQQRETKLRMELERSREEMDRCKQQLDAGLQRERTLEQMQVQVELEWQRRCEDMKAQHYLANEQLIQDLSQTRDQVDTLASEEIRSLQQQNSILRAVVAQMRKDMEGLVHGLPNPHSQPQASSSPPQPVQHPGAAASTSTTPTADPQTDTGPPAQSTNISSKVGPAGGLCSEKPTSTGALAKPEVRVEHLESALTSLMEQSALLRQLQEENQRLRQQQTSGQVSGVQDARSSRPALRTRLKQAASCIARLSREKQQLIEMGNRLRAPITTDEAVEPERESSTEQQGEQHNGLLALEQLQYQLTTQELQYALRQREHLQPGTDNRDPATEGAANPRSQGHHTTDKPERSSNKEKRLSRSQSSVDERLQPRSGLSRSHFSSQESLRSLKELWEKLDHGFSSSLLSEGEGELSRGAESGAAGVQMVLHGRSAPLHIQPPTEVQLKNPSKTPSKPSRPGAAGRIRSLTSSWILSVQLTVGSDTGDNVELISQKMNDL